MTKRRKFYWYPRWLYLLILLGPLIMVLVGLFVKRTTSLDIPLCETHLARRRKRLWIAGGWAIASVAGLFLFPLLESVVGVGGIGGWGIFASLISFLVALVWGQYASSVLSIHRIGKETATFNRASQEFLTSLPTWPGGAAL